MFCKNCGQALNDSQAVCLNCGVKKGQGNAFCQNCGNAVTPGAEVCLTCGSSLKAAGGNLNGQDKVVMIVICLFLGGIGIHNFMMGEKKKGVFKIIMALCFGISAILALIDLIRICTDTYEVNPDKLI